MCSARTDAQSTGIDLAATVEGMVHGTTVHGMGAALREERRDDAEGPRLTASFMDDLKPRYHEILAYRARISWYRFLRVRSRRRAA